MILTKSHCTLIVPSVLEAARAIMKLRGTEVRQKSDGSPVTAADLAADRILREGLAAAFPDLPVVSEEGKQPAILSGAFILVDPLDGTKDYAAGGEEFCISIGGIVDRRAAWGLLCAPALGRLWLGGGGQAESWRLDAGLGTIIERRPLRTRAAASPFLAVVSKSHPNPDNQALLQRMGPHEAQTCGSALKFARIAEGTADFYPCLSRLQQWDIAGGHALVEAAGGHVTTPEGAPLIYGAEDGGYRAEAFIAAGAKQLIALAAAKAQAS